MDRAWALRDFPSCRMASFMAARAGLASCSNRSSTEEGTDSALPWKDITSTASATVSVLTRVSISGRCTTCASSDLASAFRDTFDALEGTAAAGFVLVILLMVRRTRFWRSEEHTSELQSLMRTSYAV